MNLINEQWVAECDRFISKNLHRELKSIHGVFLPGDDFYIKGKPEEILKHMVKKICEWLQITLKKGELVVAFKDDMEPPGLYITIDSRKYIFIKSQYKHSQLAIGAILAHEMMHFYLLGRKNIYMLDEHENELLTDLCTIKFGLGIIIMNGMEYKANWFLTGLVLMAGIIYASARIMAFGYFDSYQYGQMVYNDLQRRNIGIKEFGGYVQPYARTYFPFFFWKFYQAKYPSKFINRIILKSRIIIIAQIVLLSIIIFTIGYQVYIHNVQGIQSIFTEAKQKLK